MPAISWAPPRSKSRSSQAGKPPIRILFSGDIGPDYKMLQPDPEAPTGFDYVICESTYGGTDRFERSEEKRRELLANEINAAAARKGALLIPSFAVERTQEVVTDLVSLMEQGKVPKHRDLHRFAACQQGHGHFQETRQVIGEWR